ncbi:fimbrial protein [Segatella copri]|nr:fimbrial protein [Segatella copri]
MRSRKFFCYMVILLLAAMTAACTDDLGDNTVSSGMSGNLQVLVPLMHSNGTRAGESAPAENLTYNATEEECRINSLRLFAFPQDGKGKLLNEYLGGPGTSFYEPAKFDGDVDVATYTLRIDPGTYRIYVVANMEDVLKDQTIETEDTLKNVVLNYIPEGKPGMPACGNIPMIYEPLEDTEVSDKTTDIVANLKFTCVKVKLNLIFDSSNAEMQEALKTNGLKIEGINAGNLSSSTSLVWGGKFYAADDKGMASVFSTDIYSTSSEPGIAGSYYAGWTRTDENANKSNVDVIGATGTATAAPADIKGKWLFQGTYYLPERYIKENSQQSFLTLNGKIGSTANTYTIPLGHTDNPSTEPRRTFPRGTYYEIIGTLKTLGNVTLDCQTLVKDWEPISIDADFSHTTLWVDKTRAKLTSLTNDSIFYKTNAAAVEFGCDKKISVDGKDKDFIIAAKKYNDRIIFTINPAIPYTAYSDKEREGKAKIWVKANNLIKYLDVEYNIQPLFEVDPLETTIFYEAGAETNTKKFTWVTNLGGIKIDKYNSTVGSSNITIKLENSDTDAKGTISVKAENNPTTTVEHYFKAYSKDPVDGKNIERTIKVVVKPPFGDYYIYFRAINDRTYNAAKYDGTLDENVNVSGGNYNWNDGWLQDKGSNAINVDHHNLYMYYQYGESDGTDIPEKNVWYFTGYYTNPGGNGPAGRNSRMTGAANNPGWYYYKIPKDAKGHNNHNKADREIKPGETLMIFYSYNNDGPDYHRCPHHMEPGIPLFNYEDREGWILYDPTSDPTYRIFDERPEVENVTYTVYSPYEIKRWSCNFGISNNELTGQWTLYDEVGSRTESNGSMTFSEKIIGGKKWYVTKIKLKAVKGYHEKIILIQNNSGDTNESKVLFGGRSYEKYGDTGWIERKGGAIVAWHPGVPKSGDWTDDNGNKQ